MTRIIAGSRGGRRLTVPGGSATRPTTDRVREALFSAVASWAGTAARDPAEALAGLSFCDLYAGSGAVGLEAASRGAAPVLLVEQDRRAAGLIQRNAADLGLPVEVKISSVGPWLAEGTTVAYAVVFADPPYELAAQVVDEQLSALVERSWVEMDGLIVVERSRRTRGPVWPTAVTNAWDRAYGETILYFGSLA